MTQSKSQEVIQNALADLVECAIEWLGFELEGDPGQIAVAQVIALRTGFAALAFFRASELLEFAVKSFHGPTPGILLLNILRGE